MEQEVEEGRRKEVLAGNCMQRDDEDVVDDEDAYMDNNTD